MNPTIKNKKVTHLLQKYKTSLSATFGKSGQSPRIFIYLQNLSSKIFFNLLKCVKIVCDRRKILNFCCLLGNYFFNDLNFAEGSSGVVVRFCQWCCGLFSRFVSFFVFVAKFRWSAVPKRSGKCFLGVGCVKFW